MKKFQIKSLDKSVNSLAFACVVFTFILILFTSYAQAGYTLTSVVQPVPSITAASSVPATTTRFAGRDIAYARPAAAEGMPGPVVIQGSPPATSVSTGVEGFADQVPLSVAMQQILPQGYGFTLGDGVNPGQLVSWRGGRPWHEVLQDMLAPTGLTYSMNDRLVMVTNPNGGPAVISGQQALPQAPMQASAVTPPANNYVPLPPPAPMAGDVPPPYQPGGAAMVPAAMPMQGMPPMMPQQGMAPTGPQALQIQNPALFTPQSWEAKPGQTLRVVLQDWCARVGAELHWNAEFDYPVQASLNMTGTFEEAVRTLLAGFNTAHPVPYGRLHYNPAAGQSILIVEASGNHYGD